VKAEKAAERARQKEAKEAQNNEKALQTSSKSKREVSCLSQPETKRQKLIGGSEMVLKVVISLHHLLGSLHPKSNLVVAA
jgi:hypothetical protein